MPHCYNMVTDLLYARLAVTIPWLPDTHDIAIMPLLNRF